MFKTFHPMLLEARVLSFSAFRFCSLISSSLKKDTIVVFTSALIVYSKPQTWIE